MEDSRRRSRREFFDRYVDTGIKGREKHAYADALTNTPAAFANVSSSVLAGQLVFASYLSMILEWRYQPESLIEGMHDRSREPNKTQSPPKAVTAQKVCQPEKYVLKLNRVRFMVLKMVLR